MASLKKADPSAIQSQKRTIDSFFKTTVRKVSSSSTAPPVAKVAIFDKQKWVQGLTDEQRDLLKLEIETIDPSWFKVLYPEFTKPYFLSLKRFLKQQYEAKKQIFPPAKDIYSWTRLTPLDNVKVIILGQDPYHNVGQAHGLAFSVRPPTVAPPSLKNMYKCLAIDYPDFKIPKDGNLESWAQQGVLMLNACLTVEAHQANSHAGRGWETFTETAISLALKSRPGGVCVLAWGSPAQKRIAQIKPGPEHLILRSVHPSPLSASRGFFDCHHFKKANEWLYEKYGPSGVIEWQLDPTNIINEIAQLKQTVGEQKDEQKAEILAEGAEKHDAKDDKKEEVPEDHVDCGSETKRAKLN